MPGAVFRQCSTALWMSCRGLSRFGQLVVLLHKIHAVEFSPHPQMSTPRTSKGSGHSVDITAVQGHPIPDAKGSHSALLLRWDYTRSGRLLWSSAQAQAQAQAPPLRLPLHPSCEQHLIEKILLKHMLYQWLIVCTIHH